VALSKAQLLYLDHRQSSSLLTSPRRTGFRCIYFRRCLNSRSCLADRSQNWCCQNGPWLPRRARSADRRFCGPRLFLEERSQPVPGRRRRTVATQVLRPRPADRQGIQRKGRIHSPKPGEGRFGQPPRRLAVVKLQRVRRHERRRTKRTMRFDCRPRENALRSARTLDLTWLARPRWPKTTTLCRNHHRARMFRSGRFSSYRSSV